MRNRAKCKLCNSIIESLHKNDIVTCKCGQITLDGGQEYYGAAAVDFNNFLRVDDEGNEIIVEYRVREEKDVVIQESDPSKHQERSQIHTKQELLKMLEDTLKGIDRLPERALLDPVTNADLYSFGLLVLSILRCD